MTSGTTSASSGEGRDRDCERGRVLRHLPRVDQLVSLHGAQLVAGERYHRASFTVESDKLDFEGRPLLVAMHDGADVAGRQLVRRQVLREDYAVMFLKRFHVDTTDAP